VGDLAAGGLGRLATVDFSDNMVGGAAVCGLLAQLGRAMPPALETIVLQVLTL
jgi:hypothetical protein